ncbi:MAG: tRNA pseudouridine(55) synthase TruB [Marinicellaceae bacterium]
MSQQKSKWQDVHGLLLLNKPKGMTSNTALQKVRRIFNAKKAGHTGALDPMATGLLPCCFGDSTKVAGLMLNADKVYIAECQIGSETDTADATGSVTKKSAKTQISTDEIHQATKNLTGEIQQIPPMYSAIHHNGQRLYKLARAGIKVEREARQVTIHSFKVLEINNDSKYQSIKFEIKVSKGTYIRTLIEDFAKKCNTLAHMTSLHRTKIGILTGQMNSLEQLSDADNLNQYLLPMDAALIEYKTLTLDKKQVQTLIHGLRFETNIKQGIYRLYDQENTFLGLGEAQNNGQFKVKNLFLKSYFSS